MGHTRGIITADNNAAATLANLIDAHVTANGFTWAGGSALSTTNVNVYKSAAADNIAGTDWYFFVRWINNSSEVNIAVAEAYDLGTAEMSRFVPYDLATSSITSGLAPDATQDYTYTASVGAAASALTTEGQPLFAPLAVDAVATSYEMSCTADRLVISARLDNNQSRTMYVGLLKNDLPSVVTGGDLQLCISWLKAGSTSVSSVSTSGVSNPAFGNATGQIRLSANTTSANSNGVAGFTREPNTTIANRGNFHGALFQDFSPVGFFGRRDTRYTDYTTRRAS
jgi:hypothetical protein